MAPPSGASRDVDQGLLARQRIVDELLGVQRAPGVRERAWHRECST